ncbi:hypothetical protein [Marinomonas epiphytica]
MDSQQQYEALLEKWGYADNSPQARHKRALKAQRKQAIKAFIASKTALTLKAFRKISVQPQGLKQSAH